MTAQPPHAKAIAQALDQRVIGQRTAVDEMAIALAKKLAGVPVGNVLLVGASGTGKTTLMRAVESYLASHGDLALKPVVVRMHANVLGEEARQGRPGEAVLRRLLDESRDRLGPNASLEKIIDEARRGIVFVDEVDKIRSRDGDLINTTGIRAQEALLTVMENEAVPFDLPDWAGGTRITIDSSGLLFVCAGAFEGLYDAVFDRVTIGRDKGALKPVTVVEDGEVRESLEFDLREWLRNEDLFEYGMSPQFLARFDAWVLLEDLGVEELVKIFLDSPDSGLQQSQTYFARLGIKLALSPAAARRVAREAAKAPRLGARALKEVFRRVVRRYELDPDAHTESAARAIILDEPDVDTALADS